MADGFLEGRVAWVTGGASGQGRACALALAEAGADVAVGSYLATHGPRPELEDTYYPAAGELDAVCAGIEAKGVRAFGRDLDVRAPEAVESFHDAAAAELGGIDILVNAAGTSTEHPVCGHPLELWHNVIDTNLNGVFYTTRVCLPGMIGRGWGRIVNIASTYAEVGDTDYAAYCASKSGVLGLTRCTALEGAAHGVTCNAVSPGYCDTGLLRATFETWERRARGHSWVKGAGDTGAPKTAEAYMAEVTETYPQKRLIQPQETASLVVFLCRDEALGITAENIRVSAGSLW